MLNYIKIKGAKENNLNVLKIKDGYINLYNMKGFIGGASGLINNTLCFKLLYSLQK